MSDASGRISNTGVLLSLVAAGGAISRGDLIARSGLARTTVVQHLGLLLQAGLIRETADTVRSGGRPARLLQLDDGFGVIIAIDVGETHARLAVTDLSPTMLAESSIAIDLRAAPGAVLERLLVQCHVLLSRVGRSMQEVLGIGIGLPAPVDYAAGRVVGPSVMPHWDGFDIAGWFGRRVGAPVLVENDVNLMTLSESRGFWPGVAQLLFIKAGTGIGSGIVADGRLYRGAQGAAGDIGHIQLVSDDPPLCRCGKLGCVEARAAGWSICRDLRLSGIEAVAAGDVVAMVQAGHPEATRLTRNAGRVLGEVAASVVSVLNPSVIVIGGTLARTDELLMSGIREQVFQRSLPLATRHLRIERARIGADAALLGAARLVRDVRLHARNIDRTIAAHAVRPTAAARPADPGIAEVLIKTTVPA